MRAAVGLGLLLALVAPPLAAQEWRCQRDGIEMLVGGPTRRCGATAVMATPPTTPAWTVAPREQTRRDRDRRHILEAELAAERRALAAAGSDRAARERTRQNVEALQRELARLTP